MYLKMQQSSNKGFGLVFSVFFLLLSLFYFSYENNMYLYLLATSLFFLISSFFFSKILFPFNYIWTRFGILLGKIVSPIVMMFVYFFGVFATKIFLVCFKKDILELKIDNKTISYWKNNNKNNTQSMDRQF